MGVLLVVDLVGGLLAVTAAVGVLAAPRAAAARRPEPVLPVG